MDKGVEKGKRSEEGENSMNQIIEEFFAKENGKEESGEDLIKSGFVSIVGLPNAGKSTLLNALVGQKIAITSKKAQTTRNQIMAVYDDERGQIVFHDTPGIHKAQNKLSVYMESVAEKALGNGDLILWIVDSTEQKGKKEEQILSLLCQSERKILLVLNKIDLLGGEEAVEKKKAEYRDCLPFVGIVSVSAYKNQGLEELLETIFSFLPYGPRYYDEDTVTDLPVREIAKELIREQALSKLAKEIPHGIAVLIDSMQERKNGIWDVKATLVCEKESHKGIVIGKGGSMLKSIGSGARIQIEKLLEAKVNLQLFVKVRKDWRENPAYLQEYGYREQK